MITLTPKKIETNTITINVDQTKIARGHAFMAAIRRGGKHPSRKVRREKQQLRNQLS